MAAFKVLVFSTSIGSDHYVSQKLSKHIHIQHQQTIMCIILWKILKFFSYRIHSKYTLTSFVFVCFWFLVFLKQYATPVWCKVTEVHPSVLLSVLASWSKQLWWGYKGTAVFQIQTLRCHSKHKIRNALHSHLEGSQLWIHHVMAPCFVPLQKKVQRTCSLKIFFSAFKL